MDDRPSGFENSKYSDVVRSEIFRILRTADYDGVTMFGEEGIVILFFYDWRCKNYFNSSLGFSIGGKMTTGLFGIIWNKIKYS